MCESVCVKLQYVFDCLTLSEPSYLSLLLSEFDFMESLIKFEVVTGWYFSFKAMFFILHKMTHYHVNNSDKIQRVLI